MSFIGNQILTSGYKDYIFSDVILRQSKQLVSGRSRDWQIQWK